MKLVRASTLAVFLAVASFPASALGAAQWPGGLHCDSRSSTEGTKFVKGINCRVLPPLQRGGDTRRYVAWMPAKAVARNLKGERVPVVMMLHGSGGTGEQFLKISGWKELATQKGFIAVFPTGERYRVTSDGPPRILTKWAAFDLQNDIDSSYNPPADDVGFLRRTIDDVAASAKVDGERRYLSGFSYGANMCLRGAIEMTDVFYAFGCHAGTLYEKHTVTKGNPHRPVAVSFGNQDDHLLDPYVAAGHPGATEIPMNPEASYSDLVGTYGLNFDVPSLNLTKERDIVVEPPSINVFRFDKPVSHKHAQPLQFTVLRHVEHEYPNGKNNPEGFIMAEMLWPYFEQNHG